MADKVPASCPVAQNWWGHSQLPRRSKSPLRMETSIRSQATGYSPPIPSVGGYEEIGNLLSSLLIVPTRSCSRNGKALAMRVIIFHPYPKVRTITSSLSANGTCETLLRVRPPLARRPMNIRSARWPGQNLRGNCRSALRYVARIVVSWAVAAGTKPRINQRDPDDRITPVWPRDLRDGTRSLRFFGLVTEPSLELLRLSRWIQVNQKRFAGIRFDNYIQRRTNP